MREEKRKEEIAKQGRRRRLPFFEMMMGDQIERDDQQRASVAYCDMFGVHHFVPLTIDGGNVGRPTGPTTLPNGQPNDHQQQQQQQSMLEAGGKQWAGTGTIMRTMY